MEIEFVRESDLDDKKLTWHQILSEEGIYRPCMGESYFVVVGGLAFQIDGNTIQNPDQVWKTDGRYFTRMNDVSLKVVFKKTPAH